METIRKTYNNLTKKRFLQVLAKATYLWVEIKVNGKEEYFETTLKEFTKNLVKYKDTTKIKAEIDVYTPKNYFIKFY